MSFLIGYRARCEVRIVESSTLTHKKVSGNLGLSEYESRVYVSLVEEGPSEAGKLSARCGVPRTKVYSTLKKLIEGDLAFEVPGIPLKFAPTSPSKAFQQYLTNSKEKTSNNVVLLVEATKVVSSLEEAYERTQNNVELHREELWVIEDRKEILRKIKDMLSRAKRKVVIVAKEDEFVWFSKTFGKLLDKLDDEDVDVVIRTTINSHNGRLARELGYICKVEHLNIDPPLLCLYVDDQVFLAKLNLDETTQETGENLGVFSKSQTLHHVLSLLLPKPT